MQLFTASLRLRIYVLVILVMQCFKLFQEFQLQLFSILHATFYYYLYQVLRQMLSHVCEIVNVCESTGKLVVK